MTAFIPSFATQQLLPPWEAQAHVYGISFPVPESAITRYVNTYFNAVDRRDRKFHFSAIPGYEFGIILYSKLTDVKTLNRMTSGPYRDTAEHPHTWDSLDYKELIVCVPIMRKSVNKNNVVDDSTGPYVWCQPLIICDNSTVTSSSREIIGLDVLPGKIIESYSANKTMSLMVQLYGVERFSPTSKEQLIDFLKITIPDRKLPEPKGDASNQILDAINVLGDGKVIEPGKCLPRLMNVVTLKQFRDVFDMDLAIYQALVTFTVSRPEGTNSETTFFNDQDSEIQLFQNATTKEIVSTLIGQPEPDAGRGRATLGVDKRTPNLVFKLDCKVQMDNVKTDVLLS